MISLVKWLKSNIFKGTYLNGSYQPECEVCLLNVLLKHYKVKHTHTQIYIYIYSFLMSLFKRSLVYDDVHSSDSPPDQKVEQLSSYLNENWTNCPKLQRDGRLHWRSHLHIHIFLDWLVTWTPTARGRGGAFPRAGGNTLERRRVLKTPR